MGSRILLVDDDDMFRESLGLNLSDSGFEVSSINDGEEALRLMKEADPFDLVLLDWKMPSLSGGEVLKRMRAADLNTPVILLTSLSDQIYEEAALQGGAVDFVEKSRSFLILKKRIELILGGSKGETATAAMPASDGTIEYGKLTLNVESCRAFWSGQQVDLTLTEFAMVRRLVENAGKDVRYRDLYDLLRGEDFAAGQGTDGYRANVRAFIKRIRRKFERIDAEFDEIETYPGFGYRWADGAAG